MSTYAKSFPKPQKIKRKKQDVQKIVLQKTKECWVCGTTQALHPHHIFGAANRPISDKYGLVIWLCQADHTGANGVHFNKLLMKQIHQMGQLEFEKVYSRAEFLDVFKVGNYLEV